jgi:hypothetical protein
MNSNFMVSDLIGTSVAFSLFPLFAVLPGYVCAWFLDTFGFRRRSLLARFVISIPLSIGISPILTYTLWHLSPSVGWIFYGAISMSFLTLLFRERGLWLSKPKPSKRLALAVAIASAWVVFGIFWLIDLQYHNRLYFSSVAYDYTFRSAITASITRSGVPPVNPYFYPGKSFVLRYHYFWFILCSLVQQIGGALVSPRQALMAGTVWSGLGLIAVIPLFLRFFQPKGPLNLERRSLKALALLSVTGLGIVPTTLLDIVARRVLGIESWNTPIYGWTFDMLWVPHHVASLVVNLTAFLLLWSERGERGLGRFILTSVAAGTMFASALGLSVYVTLVFAAFLTIWMTIVAVRKQFRNALHIGGAGLVALVACLPYVFELLGGHSNQIAAGGPFLQFTIRPFLIAEILLHSSWPAHGWLIPVTNTLLLPMNYFLELGFFFMIGREQWKRMRSDKSLRNDRDLCGFTMLAVSILVCTFLRSSVIAINDLSMRGIMLAQFVLLIWGAELLDEGLLRKRLNAISNQAVAGLRSGRRNLLTAMLLLGVAGTVYDVCILRFFPILNDVTDVPKYKWLSSDRDLGSRTYALRQLYEELRRELPQDAVVQHNPRTSPGDLFYGLYADRQAAAESLECGIVFGGDAASCTRIIGPIDDLFEKPLVFDKAHVDQTCNELSIDALIVKDTDPAWADKNSWVWKAKPAIANEYGKAFLCGRNAKRIASMTRRLQRDKAGG